MELRVNDYVRTNRGIIAKIIKVNSTGSITCDRSVYYGFNVVNNKRILKDFSSIVKSSPNIIDLIEENDIVNHSRVVCIGVSTDLSGTHKYLVLENRSNCANGNIKSIVTKEAFESMEYKIGE